MKKSSVMLPRLLIAAVILWCIVIWQFSATPGEESIVTSGGVMDFCNQMLRNWGVKFQFTPVMVRKIAHFVEFFILGALAAAACLWNHISRPALLAVLFSTWVAAVDECIQVLVPNRGPAFLDVVLDTCGAIFGAVLFFAALLLFARLGRKNIPI
jgi:VanZ family protein